MRKFAGLTLIELMVAMAIASIVVLGMGAVLADAQRGYNKMYDRINSEVVQDGYVAKAVFDKIVRKSSMKSYILRPLVPSVTLYYYSDANQVSLDRYATFEADIDSNDLTLTEGVYDESTGTIGEVLSTRDLAGTVADCWFSVPNVCVQMHLELDNGKESLMVTCSSIRHNE